MPVLENVVTLDNQSGFLLFCCIILDLLLNITNFDDLLLFGEIMKI